MARETRTRLIKAEIVLKLVTELENGQPVSPEWVDEMTLVINEREPYKGMYEGPGNWTIWDNKSGHRIELVAEQY